MHSTPRESRTHTVCETILSNEPGDANTCFWGLFYEFTIGNTRLQMRSSASVFLHPQIYPARRWDYTSLQSVLLESSSSLNPSIRNTMPEVRTVIPRVITRLQTISCFSSANRAGTISQDDRDHLGQLSSTSKFNWSSDLAEL